MEPVTEPELKEEGPAFSSPFENGGLFVRSMLPGPGFVEAIETDKRPTLVGKLAVFDEWAEIKSRQEGHFLERISRGAFTKTLQGAKVPVLFQHGEDPQIGGKPLGKIMRLEETDRSVDYEVELFDTDYVRSILPALQAGEFGSSFTFNPVKDKTSVTRYPQRSSYNPDRLPEVVHHEVKMREFGPGIMPYYAGATAGVRSATDEFLFGRFAQDPARLRELLTTFAPDSILTAEVALSNERAEVEPHSGEESRNVPLVPVRKRFQSTQGWLVWCESALK
jgi:HK97 family phage prohead protease